MFKRWLALIGLGSFFFATVAQAGTLTGCTATYYTILSGPTSIILSTGSCVMSSTYGAHGDVFPGTGTAAENAAFTLCGSAADIVIGATLTGFQVLAAYDATFSSIRLVHPTHVDAASLTGSATFTGTPNVLTGTNSAPTITLANDGTGTAVGVKTGALAMTAGATGVTGVQAPVLTMNSYTPAGTIDASGIVINQSGNGIEMTATSDNSGNTINFIAFCRTS